MLLTLNSLFDIYPDKLRKGAVVGYTKADGTPLEFPCTLDTGDAVMDAKGRWTASGLGLKPVVAKYSEALKRTETKEAWVGDGFGTNPNVKYTVENTTLERVRFVDDVTSIGYCAFSGWTALTNITIPNSVKEISSGAFLACTALTSITIPKGVKAIGFGAFLGCSGLTDIYVDQPESGLINKTELPYGCTVHWKQAEAV